MNEPKRARIYCVIAGGAGLILGLIIGFLSSEGTVKNANIFLRHGAIVSHVHVIDCNIIGNTRALDFNLGNNRITESPGFVAAMRAEESER